MNTDEHGSKRESYLCSSVFIRGSKSVFPERRAAMKPHRVLILGLLAAMLAAAQSGRPPRVALVNIQDAMLATTDGQNAAKTLDAEFGPRKAALDEVLTFCSIPPYVSGRTAVIGKYVKHKMASYAATLLLALHCCAG